MEEFNMDEFNNLSTDDQWLVLLLLVLESSKIVENQVQQFENDLIYKNRFSSKHAVVDAVHKHEKDATILVQPGKTYYRARIFKDFSIDKLVKYYLKELGKTDEQIKEILNTWDKTQKANALSNAEFFVNSGNQQNYTPEQIAMRNAQRKWRKGVKFKGYGPRDSTAPKPDKVTNGRANPDHIRYLYVCEDEETPVYEVRPIIGDQVSVAQFRLSKEVRLYDLTLPKKPFEEQLFDSVEEYESAKLFIAIGAMFSRPFNGDPAKYIATQFLAEEIKNMGFDGLRFNSSLNTGGINVVLFDPDACKAISSELVEVKGIHIQKDEAQIYKIGSNNQSL
jgi:hypothetical protein